MFCLGMSLSDEELLSNSRRTSGTDCDSLRHQMEMLSFSVARTISVINKQTGTVTLYLALINRAGGLYRRILTEVVSTDRTQ